MDLGNTHDMSKGSVNPSIRYENTELRESVWPSPLFYAIFERTCIWRLW